MRARHILSAAVIALPIGFPIAANAQTPSCQVTGEYDTENHPTAPLFVESNQGDIRGIVGDMLYKGVAKPSSSCVFSLEIISLASPTAFDGHSLEFVSSAGRIKASMTRPGGSIMRWGASRTSTCTPQFGQDFDKLFDMKANAAAYERQCRLQSSFDCSLYGEFTAGNLRPKTPGLDLIGGCGINTGLVPVGINPVARPVRPNPVLEAPVVKPSDAPTSEARPKARPMSSLIPDGK